MALGFLAAALTTGSWLPQVLRTWADGHSDQISGLYLLCFACGVGSWMVYGVLTSSVPLVAANAVSLVLILSLAALKVRHVVARP